MGAGIEVRAHLPHLESHTPETEACPLQGPAKALSLTSVTTHPHGQSQDVCHYTPAWTVSGCLSYTPPRTVSGRLSLGTYMHSPKMPVCHYIATQPVAGCLSPHYYMDSSQVPVSTHLHGFLQDTCHSTSTWSFPKCLSLHTYVDADCPMMTVTIYPHHCPRTPVTVHLPGFVMGEPSWGVRMPKL